MTDPSVLTSSLEPSVPTSLVPLLIVAVVALAGTVAFLFRHYSKCMAALEASRAKEREDRAQEREEWVLERARHELERAHHERRQVEVRAEYESRHREVLKSLYDDAREHEDRTRREYAENIEVVAEHQAKASERVTQVLDKIYDRFDRLIGSRPH